MKSDLENKKDLIGADEGIDMSVVKLKGDSILSAGVNKGNLMPVVKLGNDLPHTSWRNKMFISV